MDQELRVHTALVEDLSLSHSSHVNHVELQPQGIHWHSCAYMPIHKHSM